MEGYENILKIIFPKIKIFQKLRFATNKNILRQRIFEQYESHENYAKQFV